MGYTTPPPMSASTLLGATQLNIIAEDLIDIDGRCKAPNVPFERASLSDVGGSPRYAWRGWMLHKYISSAHLPLEYTIQVSHDGGTGTVCTDLIIGGTAACSFSASDAGTQTFQGNKDLSFLTDADGKNTQILLDVRDADRNGDGTAKNTTTVQWMGQLKITNTGYTSFRDGRFTDGDTGDVTGDLSRLRSSIINLDGYADRGVGGFRARETGDITDGDGNQTLFDGYLKTTGAGGLYMILGFARNASDPAIHTYVKTVVNGSSMTTIDHSSRYWIGRTHPQTTACTFSLAGYTMNDELRVTVTACTNATDYGNCSRARLIYLAEVPSGSMAGWVSPGTYTSGSYVLGNANPGGTDYTNIWLSTAASNVEHLAGDTGGSGYGTDYQTAAKPIGTARACYRFPVYKAGDQDGQGKINVISDDPSDGGKRYQRIYNIHTGATAYARCKSGILKYGPTGSPFTHRIEDPHSATGYRNIDLEDVGDLAYGMLYYSEVELSQTDATVQNDYLEERP